MSKHYNRLWILLGLSWTLVIASFAWHESVSNYDLIIDHARLKARGLYENDLLHRRWVADHGGVYVPIDANTPPNPYLQNIPERDIVTPSGRKLTLVNPAYMMRQVNELAATRPGGSKEHLTSLNPLRPQNSPDPWEATALQSFERGELFASTITEWDGISYLRTMFPFVTEKVCLKCHAAQGYKVGDIRGGVSISVPLTAYQQQFRAGLPAQIAYHTGIWLLGLFCLLVFRHKTQQQFVQTETALEEALILGTELENSRERFRVLSDASFGGTIIHDQGLILDCNQGLVDITGYAMDDLIGRNGLDLFEPESLPQVLENIKSGYDKRYEVEGVRKDGSVYPLSIKGGNVQYQGREVRVIELRDITEHKKAEETLRRNEARQRAMLENIGDVIVIIDQEGINRYNSANVERWFGWNSQELLGRATLENVHPDDLQRTQKIFAELLQWGNIQKTVECRYRCKDGSYKWIEFTGVNRRHDPDIGGILGNYHDITERLEHEKEQQKMEKLESIGMLAGGLAHDFNNLLAGLYGNVSLMKMRLPTDHPASRYIDAIEKSMNSAKLLTNQFLTFTKGGDPLQAQLDVFKLVQEIVNFNLSGSNIKLAMTPAEDLWMAHVDQGQIEQVFANLTVNAKQAMSDGGQLSIRLQNVCVAENEIVEVKEGRYVQVVVADNGCGVEAEMLDRIFDPYFTTKETGSGLGLATIHSIIKRHGGHISVSSQPFKGTRFTIYLPAAEGEGSSASPAKPISGARSLSSKILVMDDEEVIRETLTALLESLDCRVESASNGQQAVECYQKALERGEPFDLALLDLTIPGEEGGRKTAQKILQIDPTARLIVSSGYSADAVLANYQDYGFKGAVKKPYLVEDLAAELQRVLESV